MLKLVIFYNNTNILPMLIFKNYMRVRLLDSLGIKYSYEFQLFGGRLSRKA